MCYIAFVLPPTYTAPADHHRERRSEDTEQADSAPAQFLDAAKGFIPLWGPMANSRAIRHLTQAVETALNVTAGILTNNKAELQVVRLVALQNRIVLDVGTEGPKPSGCTFTIERILGLDKEPAAVLKPHRPWLDPGTSPVALGSPYIRLLEMSCKSPLQGGDRLELKERSAGEEKQSPATERGISWYRGRRPRTAFIRSQIETLENIFRLNSYPGIDIREELAEKLDLDEDQIQVVT
ncbi:homeobox expressed in ES cells 1-like [Lissotriton helveticus]